MKKWAQITPIDVDRMPTSHVGGSNRDDEHDESRHLLRGIRADLEASGSTFSEIPTPMFAKSMFTISESENGSRDGHNGLNVDLHHPGWATFDLDNLVAMECFAGLLTRRLHPFPQVRFPRSSPHSEVDPSIAMAYIGVSALGSPSCRKCGGAESPRTEHVWWCGQSMGSSATYRFTTPFAEAGYATIPARKTSAGRSSPIRIISSSLQACQGYP